MFGNLNSIASRYIPQQKVLWFRFKERGPDDEITRTIIMIRRSSWQLASGRYPRCSINGIRYEPSVPTHIYLS